MTEHVKVWAGIDVGGPRKGFHVAIIDERSILALGNPRTHQEVVGLLGEWAHRPNLVAVDAPLEPALVGERSRLCERQLVKGTGVQCFYTPDEESIESHSRGFYDWMKAGFSLYKHLRVAGFEAIECFPTATWTRLGGLRGRQSRARWTSAIYRRLKWVDNPSKPTGQDFRDAVGAALTAFLHTECRDLTECFGSIVIPMGAEQTGGLVFKTEPGTRVTAGTDST